MYEETKYAINLNKGYLEAIDSPLGLKEGCPLSPILFNFYIDDINIIFKNNIMTRYKSNILKSITSCMLTT